MRHLSLSPLPPSTLFDDDTKSTKRLNLSDINVGDFLEVEAYDDGDNLIATRIDRSDSEESDENFEIQGSVQSFTSGLNITVFKCHLRCGRPASFETDNDRNVDIDTFFALLNAGDIVEIEFSSNAPTTAIKVELEEDERPDGGLEFDDDDDSDEDSEDESDGQSGDDDTSDDSDEDSEDESDGQSGDDDTSDDSDEDSEDESDDSDDDSDDDSGDDEPSDG